MNLSEWALRHRPLVLFLMLLSAIAGLWSFSRLDRLEDPQFTLPVMTVMVAWPGATPEQLQNQVLNRLELQIQDIDRIDFIRSFARQNYGGITITVKGGTSRADIQHTWYVVRKKIGDIRMNLPAGIQGPLFNDEFDDVYTFLYALRAEGLSQAELLEYAENIKRELQTVPNSNKVNILGQQAERVYVEFSSAQLASWQITPSQIANALARANPMMPAGFFATASDQVMVRTSGALSSLEQIRNLQLDAGGGRQVRLGDVAQVRTGSEDPPNYTVRHNGRPVLVIALNMRSSGNLISFGRDVQKKIEEVKQKLPSALSLEQFANQSQIVEASVWEFERSFLEALAIVLAVSFLFLGWRTGVVVALSVPLVLAIVAIVMFTLGWTLDRVSLGALIIALGLLVDDAIIAVEMMLVKMEQGWSRIQAASFAYTSTAFPMLTGTLITVAGFMPVGFAKSTSGEYAGGIFWVVGTALLASWLVAVIFIPYLGVKLLPQPKAGAEHHPSYDGRFYQRFRRVLHWALEHRYLTLGATVASLALALFSMQWVQQQFFPTASRPELLVELRLKEGSSFQATEALVRHLEPYLAQDRDIQSFTAYTGAGSPRFFLSLNPELPNPGYAQFVLKTGGLVAREAVRARLLKLLESDSRFASAKTRVLRLEFGPPVGFPVQFRVTGAEPDVVRHWAYQVRDILEKSPLLLDVHLDWNDKVRVMRVRLDDKRLKALALDPTDVSQALQIALGGSASTQIRRGEVLVDVVVRAKAQERSKPQQLAQLPLLVRPGQVVLLEQVGRVESAWEDPVLWRRDRKMNITVRADVKDGIQAPYATGQVWPQLQTLMKAMPEGYGIERGGAVEESEKANQALFAVFPVMLGVILLLLMLQLKSFSRMALVFLTAPLGMVGVVPALLLTNSAFGFVALMGVIALGGMIMRNAIILVDQIEQDIGSGLPRWQAIVESTIRRARPVVLTALAAVLAMVPLVPSVFWGPMAVSIMGGLVAATALTLLVVPALYAVWFKVRASEQ